MKRRIALIITGVIVAGALAGCGGGSGNYSKSEAAMAPMYEESYASDDMYDSYSYEMEEAAEYANGSGEVEKVGDEAVANSTRKIIKTVSLSCETEEFDTFIANINTKVNALGGYLESTDISGRSINASKSSMRYANITARIPSQNLNQFVSNVSENSNITNKNESANDVTLSYADTAAHIKSLRTEQERLDELLLQAEDIETIIAIEARITDVRYELESYESRLRTMDNQVEYSTVYLNVSEVERYTPVEEPKQTIGQRIAFGFTENLIEAKDFLVDFFVGCIVSIPIIAVLLIFVAIPVLVIFLFVRFIVGQVKGPEYRAQRKAKRAEKKANKANKKNGAVYKATEAKKAEPAKAAAPAQKAESVSNAAPEQTTEPVQAEKQDSNDGE